MANVYMAPVDGTVAPNVAWVSDVCSNCGRVHLLTQAGLNVVPAEFRQSPSFGSLPGVTEYNFRQTQYLYRCHAPAPSGGPIYVDKVIGGALPTAVTAAIASGNVWN